MTNLAHKDLIKTPILAGIAYFELVFALGFLLGTARTFFVRDAPSGGRLIGVLIELPLMIGASWFLCRHLVRRFAVASTVVARSVMGGLAFALLLLAELLAGASNGAGPAILNGSSQGPRAAPHGNTGACHVSVLVRLSRKATIFSISASVSPVGRISGVLFGSGLPPPAM
jgi:hypothetical protein